MAKLFSVCFLLLFFLSCNQNDCGKKSENSSEESQAAKCVPTDTGGPGDTGGPEGPEVPEGPEDPEPEEPSEPGDGLPSEAYLFDVNADLFKFTKEEEDKVRRAFEIIKAVVATKEFRDAVLNHVYKGQKSFHDNDNFSNARIYQMILDGKETLLPVIDNRMNLELELYTNNSTSTVGYTYPTGLRIFLNRKFYKNYTASEVAGNLFHEWLHKVGFTHDSKNTAGRDKTVPYALGYIMRELGKNVK